MSSPEERLSPNKNKERIVNVFLSGLERKKKRVARFLGALFLLVSAGMFTHVPAFVCRVAR